MVKQVRLSIILVFIGVLLLETPNAFAQIEFLNRKIRLQFMMDEYLVWRENMHRKQKVQLSHNLTVWRHRFQMEGRFNLVENEELIINFYAWAHYYYESGPDINRRIRHAMPSRARYKQYQAPFYDGDDIIMEAYLDFNYGPWTIRAGKQKVVWGETSLVQTIDIINPLDLRYSSPGIDDFDELKLGVWMLRLFYQSELPGDLIFELIFNPGDYEEMRLGIQGSDRGAPSVPNEEFGHLGSAGLPQQLRRKSYPSLSISNYELGFRLRGLWDFTFKNKVFETLWTLNYFNTLDDVMIVDKVDEYNKLSGEFALARLAGDWYPRLDGKSNIYDAKRFTVVGGSFQTYDPLFTKGVIRFESAYFIGKKYNKRTRQVDRRIGKIERDYITYGLEFVRPFRTMFLKKLDHHARGYTDVTLGINQGWFIGNVNRIRRQFSYGSRSETNFILMLMTHFRNQEFTPVFRMRYNTRNWGYWTIALSYSITTNLKMSFGFSENFGSNRDDNGIAAAYNKDRFYYKLKIQF